MARSGLGRLHGYLVVDKPAGWTSHDVVGRIRRLTGERKVGHAGTLDPAATGVLPVAIGTATRSLEFLSDSSKTYLAEITFGITTDSFDADGTVTAVCSPDELDAELITAGLEAFRGPILQVPPMHSAIKIGGRRLYELARKGEEIEREPRAVVIHEARLLAWDPPVATVCIDCSKGTYIRSIAHDLGQRLGVGAYLSNLVRVRTGSFDLSDAWTIGELEQTDLISEWERVAVHPDAGASDVDALIINENRSVDWSHGKPLAGTGTSGWVRVYDEAGNWRGIALGVPESGLWQPHKVVTDAA